MDLRIYLKAIRKHWWIVLGVLAVGLGSAAAVTIATVPKYQSSVTFFINTPSDTIAGSAQGDSFGQKRVNTYVQLITTDKLTNLVAAELNNGMTADDIASEISARGDVNTVLLTTTVTDPSLTRSMSIAASISTNFVALVDGLERADAATAANVRLEVVDGPSANPSPVEPYTLKNFAIGGLLALLLGLALAVVREAFDTTIRSGDDLAAATGAPVMGVIGFDADAKKNPLILGNTLHSIRGEAFRQLRTNLQFVNAASPVKVLVVTSSVSAEGKSTTATNLAITFADAGSKVLLVEGDLRRPRVADYLGIEGAIGLTNVLVGQVDLSEVLQGWGASGNLTVLASGSIPPNPSEMLGSEGMIRLIGEVRERFDMVIIDAPPLLPVTDAAIMSTYADGALLVARYGTTTRTQAALSAKALGSVDARVLGSILSMAPTKGVDAYGYGYGYAYTEDETGSRSKLELSEAQLSPTVRDHVQNFTDNAIKGAVEPRTHAHLERHRSTEGASPQS